MGMINLDFGFWNPDFGFYVWNPKVYGDDYLVFWILESRAWIPRLESKGLWG